MDNKKKKKSLENVLIKPHGNVYIARDKDRVICLYYAEKPHRVKSQIEKQLYWDIYSNSLTCIANSEMWPMLDKLISWEDEPMLFEITVRKQKRK